VSRGIYRNLESLIAARGRYARINVPVALVYGDNDWSRPPDRQANIESVPGARDIVLRDTGHFAALEAPDDWARILLGDAPERGGPAGPVTGVLLLAERRRRERARRTAALHGKRNSGRVRGSDAPRVGAVARVGRSSTSLAAT